MKMKTDFSLLFMTYIKATVCGCLSKVLLVQTTCSGISTYEFSKLCQCQYLLSIII